MADLKVAFPEPCTQPWADMSPVGCHRHCESCDRIVHDLGALTTEEVERLLDTGDQLCVRAEVGHDGIVKTRGSGRRMVLGAGAMLLAACQTTPGGRVNGGASLSGQTLVAAGPRDARIVNSAGESAILFIGDDGRFAVDDLAPGTYTLRIPDYCGKTHEVGDIVVASEDIDLGRLDLETSCIVVGRLERAEPPLRA